MFDLLKKIKIIISVLWVLIIPTTSKSIRGEEYRADKWHYLGVFDVIPGYPFSRGGFIHYVIGTGANSKNVKGIGVGTSLLEVCGNLHYRPESETMTGGSFFPLYIRFIVPVMDIRFDSSLLKTSEGYYYPCIFHLFCTGSMWGIDGTRWFGVGVGVDFSFEGCVYLPVGLEGGFMYIADKKDWKTSLYAGVKIGLGHWSAIDVKKVPTPVKPTPRPPKPAQVVAQKPVEIKKKKTITEYPTAPDFSLLSLKEGARLSLSELLGKRTVLYFWTPLSTQMKVDMIELQKLYSKHRNAGLQIVAILAFPEDIAEALAFVDSAKIAFVNLIGDRETAIKYRVTDVAPAVVIIDENKKIIATEKSNLTDELLKIIIPSPPPTPILLPPPKSETAYFEDFSSGTLKNWKPLSGDWLIVDGMLAQNDRNATPAFIILDTENWQNYTLELKARKIDGREGFLIGVRFLNNKNVIEWPIGGWGNTRSCLIRKTDLIGKQGWEFESTIKNNTIESGRWYNIKVVVKGANIKCYLDEKLIIDYSDPEIQKLSPSTIGIGTWATRAYFDDIKITIPLK